MIGLLYLMTSIVAGSLGFLYSCFIRTDLSLIGCGILFGDYQMYNVLITAHGLAMIFGFIMPVVLGAFTNYFLPGLLGLPDMLFARLNNLSYWLYLLGTLFLLLSVLVEEGIGIGWTLYPSLSCVDFHSSISVDMAMFSVHMLGISSLMNSINVIGTILACRRRYFGLIRITLFV